VERTGNPADVGGAANTRLTSLLQPSAILGCQDGHSNLAGGYANGADNDLI
jgi:hypothetical protein